MGCSRLLEVKVWSSAMEVTHRHQKSRRKVNRKMGSNFQYKSC